LDLLPVLFWPSIVAISVDGPISVDGIYAVADICPAVVIYSVVDIHPIVDHPAVNQPVVIHPVVDISRVVDMYPDVVVWRVVGGEVVGDANRANRGVGGGRPGHSYRQLVIVDEATIYPHRSFGTTAVDEAVAKVFGRGGRKLLDGVVEVVSSHVAMLLVDRGHEKVEVF
jgi:hypothetical protein